MAKSHVRLSAVAAAVVSAIGFPAPSVAAPPADDPVTLTFDLPAGLACPSFELRIEVTSNPNRPLREFQDENGNVVRVIEVGRGSTLVFTNRSTGQTLSLRPNGSGSITRVNADGTSTVSSTGHNVVVLFPDDVPAGPSTILYVGRLVYTDSNGLADGGMFTVQSFNGTQMDICAALA
jgi:hypothetical protein